MTTAHQLKPALKKRVQNAMEKWYRDLFVAYIKKDKQKTADLLALEENNRRAGEWTWDADCFDAEYVTDVMEQIERGKEMMQ